MNFILRLLGYRPARYRGEGFSVEIKSMVRESVSIIYRRDQLSVDLMGERTGRKWKGIQVGIPEKVAKSPLLK